LPAGGFLEWNGFDCVEGFWKFFENNIAMT